MQKSDLEMDWGFDIYEESGCFVENPVSYMYEFKIFEDDLSSDFQSSFTFVSANADVKLEDLSTRNNLSSNIVPATHVPEISPDSNSEPCAAALAIAANIPCPKPRTLHQWRTFINSAYYHPNIMAHFDVNCLKELFQLFGSNISFGSVNVMINLGKGHKEYKPVYNLRPKLSPLQKPPIFAFAQIKEFSIDLELQVCVVKKYNIIDSMKTAINEMVNFIIEFPEALYLETYGFVLDFLLKFRVRSEVIIDAVMRTQCRRRRSQKPASVLLLKQANKLGKGRKEFLQKRLLCSPEKTYDPVVPIITEPTSFRHLRNRKKSATIEESCAPASLNGIVKLNDSTVKDTIILQDKKPIDKNVRAVTRNLFADFGKTESNQTIFKNEDIPFITQIDTASSPANGVTPKFIKRKKIYVRRDESTMEKPFVCNICPDKRSFAYKGNLVIHIKSKHMDEASKPPVRKHRPKPDGYIPPYSCPACLRGYATKLICKIHIQQFHADKTDCEPLCNIVAHFKSSRRPRLARNTTSKASFKKTKHKVRKVSTKTVKTSTQLNNDKQNYDVCPLPHIQEFPVDVRFETGINVQLDGLQFDALQSVTNRQFGTAVK